jgi:capsular exopolysaccharide synthesis family protein
MSPENLSLIAGSLHPAPLTNHIGDPQVAFSAMNPPPVPVVNYLLDYWRILLKYRWTIVAFTIVVTTLTSIVSVRMVPQYVSQSLIAIYRESSEGLGLRDSKSTEEENWDSSIDLDTQVKVLQSDSLAMQVIRDLRLDQEPKFTGGSPLDSADPRQQAALLSRFHRALKVTILPRTRVAQIQFTSTNPQLAARVANALANSYIDQNFKTKFESAMRTSEWLSKQLADLEVKVEASQEKLVRYEREKGILGLDEKQNIVTSKLDDLNKQATQAQGDRIAKEAAYQSAQSANAESIAGDGDLLAKLREQQDALQLQLAQATTRLGPAHPKVMELTNQLKELESSIATEAARVRLRANSEYQRALHRERLLKAALDDQKREENDLNESAIDYNLLKRDVDSNRQLYESLLQKLKEAGVSASLHSNNVRIIDAALIPVAPSSPNIPRNVALGFIVSLIGGMTLALILDSIDNTVTTPEQAEALTGLPGLGFIPVLTPLKRRNSAPSLQMSGKAITFRRKTLAATAAEDWSPALATHTKPFSEMAESYRSLRTAILLSGVGKPPKVLMITSSIPQEGKTTTALNTAIVLAQKGSRVLLIDADMRRPGISKSLGLVTREVGLGTVLAGGDKLENAIVPSAILDNLWILPAEPLPPHPAELLASEQMRELLVKCRERFDHVIIDTPPILLVTDAVQLSPLCDAVALVIRAGKTSKGAVRQSSTLLARVGAHVRGVIMNAVDVQGNDGYYYYYYGAKSKYKYYGTEPPQHPQAP